MTNNNNPENWQPSTKHRDEHNKKESESKIIRGLIKAVNVAVKGYNATIGKAAGWINVDIKLPELDPNKSASEIMSGGGALTLGVVDDAIKGVRRIGLPALQAVSVFGWGGPQIAAFLSVALAPAEIAVDHLKDAMTSMAFSGLAADIGDLKDGQAKLNAKVDAQGKRLGQKMDNIKSELEGTLKQQAKELEEQIKNASAEQKKALQKQKEELERQIREVTENLDRVKTQLTNALNDFRNEVNERFAEQEQKILNNKRKIEEERIKREQEIRETNDRIKLTTTNLENLRKEKEQIEDEFITYKSQINQQTADAQQSFEDLEAEYQRKTKILEAQIEDNQEILQEFSEELDNTRREQAFQREQQTEIWEELQETNDLLFTQQHKLNLVSQQMEDISEEIHERMDEIKKDHNQLFTLVTKTNQKLDQLTEEVQNIQATTEQLQEQIKKNKEETEKAKQEAKLANERLDNLLKSQALRDYSAEQSKLDKIQKSLELKAEETKLIATLNLLQETKQLIQVEPSKRDWKVGVKTGTVDKDFPETEGYRLAPNSWWERNYTGDQVKPDNPYSLFTPEWFKWEEENYLPPEQTKFEPWGERIKGEHESAYLTDPERRKEEQTENNKSEAKQEKTQPSELVLERLENLKSETLSRLQEIQHQIRTNLAAAENTPPAPSPTQQKLSVIQQEIQQKKQLFNQKQQKVKNLEKKPVSPKNQQQLEQTKEEQREAERQLQEAQAQLSDPGLQLDQEIEKLAAETIQKEQEELEQQWSILQALNQQALQRNKNQEEPKETKENDLDKKLEELVQQLKEMEQSATASQKTMSMFMLFLIIFLLEYVVYKRNGLLGLVVLNVLLAIAYYHRDTLKEYSELWGKYLLILGYVMGNVLAYSAPEQEKYKWPSVIGFNLAILGIYTYTLYQQKQEQAKIEAHYQQKTKEICEENNITNQEWKEIQQNSTKSGGIIDEYSIFSNSGNEIRTEQLEDLKIAIQTKEIATQNAQQKELEIQQQKETLQKAAQIEEKLRQAQDSLGTSSMSWQKIHERYPEFKEKSILLKEFEKADKLLSQDQDTEPTKSLMVWLGKIPLPNEEEQQLLANLYLTPEQFIALFCQTQHLTAEEKKKINDNYSSLTTSQKLQLLNAGLNNLGINTYSKKENFVKLNHQLYHEKKSFGLTTSEKEGVLRLLINTLNLSQEQRKSLENMGVSFFNASHWEVSEEQKDNLLKFGLSRIELTEEQQKNLTHAGNLKAFGLQPQQKNILTSLSPLLKENRYSEETQELLNSLDLKFNNLSFLVNHQIIPNPHTDFGKVPNPYLTLKTKFLAGEQKTLREENKVKEKILREEEIQAQKLSIINSLLKLLEDDEHKDLNISLSLDNWVKIGVLQEYQKNILLTLGFKTIPRYHYFELLIFAVENFTDYSWDDFIGENMNLNEDYQEYLNSLNSQEITINKTIWEKFVSSKSKKEREIFKDLNLEELINEKINQALGNYKPQQEIFYDSQEELSETEEPQPSSSRYDDLLANLSQEEAERQKKKLAREEAHRKLEAAERKRREAKLSEKDQKLKEQEERRQQEKELAEKEEQKREEARLAREKTLQEEQDTYFATKTKNLAERKKAAELALENQKKENELQEQKRQDEIAKMKKENKEEQKRLEQQAKDIEKKKQEELAAIALEDEEQRQLIEKRANEEKIRIQKEIDERKRKDEEELKKKENQLLKEREEWQQEIAKMEEERKLAEKAEADNKALYEQEKKSRQDLERQRANTLKITAERMDAQRRSEALRENNAQIALRSILWYPMLDDEWNRCTQGGSHFGKCPTVQEGFNRYSNLRINPSFFQFDSGKWVNSSGGGTWTYSRASDLRKAVALCGNRWFTKSELENHIKNNVGERW